jgi:tRNA(fMet)-specific endonuclease VapC
MRILDTNILSLFLRGDPKIVGRLGECDPAELAITIVNVEKMLNGWHARIRKAKTAGQITKSYQFLREAVQFAGSVHIQDFTPAAQQRFVELRKQYRRIGTNDLRIAAIVLEHNAILVIANVRDFRKIDGINIEDWTG